MNENTKAKNVQPLAVDVDTLSDMLGVGRNTAFKVGAAAGARICVGRRVLFSVKKIDAYIDSLTGV